MVLCLLVGFLELINLVMNKFSDEQYKKIINNLKQEAENSLLCELCALVGVDKENGDLIYKIMKNRSKTPEDFFMIDPYDYLSFIDKNELLLIFHSHLLGDELPSDFDIKTSENCCYPFLIYSVCTEKFCIYEPQYKNYNVSILEGIRKSI